jgi:hypothetical protein
MCFALTATAFMVCAHNRVVGPPQVGEPPHTIDEMSTTVTDLSKWELCPTILDGPEMAGWHISRAQWLDFASKWCIKPVAVRDRMSAREHRDHVNHRQAGRKHRRRVSDQEHL